MFLFVIIIEVVIPDHNLNLILDIILKIVLVVLNVYGVTINIYMKIIFERVKFGWLQDARVTSMVWDFGGEV